MYLLSLRSSKSNTKKLKEHSVCCYLSIQSYSLEEIKETVPSLPWVSLYLCVLPIHIINLQHHPSPLAFTNMVFQHSTFWRFSFSCPRMCSVSDYQSQIPRLQTCEIRNHRHLHLSVCSALLLRTREDLLLNVCPN